MIYKAMKFFGAVYLATFGVHAAASNDCPDLALSEKCMPFMLTEQQRLIAVFCQTVNTDTMHKFAASTAETQRRLDETASLVRSDVEQAARLKMEKSVKGFNSLSGIFTSQCPQWQAEVPADCQTEIATLLANSDQNKHSHYEL